jgi:ureidoacrylate peracid hydrolase
MENDRLKQPEMAEPVMLKTQPQPLKIHLRRTALIVIDVQNAFLSEGGFFTLESPDMELAETIRDPGEKIKRMRQIIHHARGKGIQVIYTLSINPPHEIVGPDSPYLIKNDTVILERKHPEFRDKLINRGTWGAEIIDELKPQEGDILVEKPRYSAFFQTYLETLLKTYNLKYLLFVGVATNICVEATIRDAYYREYFSILISDAAVNSGPEYTQEATIFNVRARYGWVTDTEKLLAALR